MSVEQNEAAAKAQYAGQTYYFCSVGCQKAFTADPRKYVGGAPSGGPSHGGGSQQHGRK
jgi:Cu+-exporting ATPase